MILDSGLGDPPTSGVTGIAAKSVAEWRGWPGDWEMPGTAHMLLGESGEVAVRAGVRRAVLRPCTGVIMERSDDVLIRCAGPARLVAIELLGAPRGAAPFRFRRFGPDFADAIICTLTSRSAVAAPDVGYRKVAQMLDAVAHTPPKLASGRVISAQARPEVVKLVERLVDGEPEPLTCEVLAHDLSVTRKTLHDWVVSAAGCGLGELLREQRACLLNELVSCACLSVQEASRAAGFDTVKSAQAAYRRAWGISITQRRSRLHGQISAPGQRLTPVGGYDASPWPDGDACQLPG